MNRIKSGDYAREKATGRVFRVDHVNDNPNREADGEIYLEGWNSYGSVTIDSPDDVEKADWSPPSADDLARALSGALHEWGGDIEVHETDIQDDRGLVAALGRWKGMEGGFLVRFGPWDEEMM